MLLRTKLRNFIKVVADEAEQNPEFAERLHAVLDTASTTLAVKNSSKSGRGNIRGQRPANRRPAAVLDPVSLATQGEEILRQELATLTLEQLKDIVAEYGMDRERLVMKWKKPQRVVERIVEISISRAHKGDAFRS